MAISVQLKFDQGASFPAGQAAVGVIAVPVVCTAVVSGSPLLSVVFSRLSVPFDSGLALGNFGATNPSSFTPDVPGGSYRIKVVVTGTDGSTASQVKVFSVPTVTRTWIIPAFDGTAEEHNYGGQIRGWAGPSSPMLMDAILRDMDVNLMNGGVEVVANIAALKAIAVAALNVGELRYVTTLHDVFELLDDAATFADADDITKIAPTIVSGNKVWGRKLLGSQRWLEQPTWFINSALGSDEAVGDATGVGALKTWAELARRMGPQATGVGASTISYVVTIEADMPNTDPLDITQWWARTPGSSLIVTGIPTAIPFNSTFTATTTINPAGQLPQVVVDTVFGIIPSGSRIRLDASAGNQIAWALGSPGAFQTRTSPFCDYGTDTSNPPSAVPAFDDYIVETLPQVTVVRLQAQFTANLELRDLNVITSRPTSAEGEVKFVACKITSFSGTIAASGTARQLEFVNCYFENKCFLISASDARVRACSASDVLAAVNSTVTFTEWGSDTRHLDKDTRESFIFYSSQCGIYDDGGAAFAVEESVTVRSLDFIWGPNPNGAIGIRCRGKWIYEGVKPTVAAGLGVHTLIDEVPRAYTQIPYTSPSGAGIIERDVVGLVHTAVIVANLDNYNFGSATLIRLNGGLSNWDITGLLDISVVHEVRIVNIGTTHNFVLKHLNGGSTAPRQIAIPGGADYTLVPGDNATLSRDPVTAVWRVMA